MILNNLLDFSTSVWIHVATFIAAGSLQAGNSNLHSVMGSSRKGHVRMGTG
jgi:hypothetical protein